MVSRRSTSSKQISTAYLNTEQKDQIFRSCDSLSGQETASVLPFSFNTRVVEVFDDMISRSIPCYQEVQKITRVLAKRYYQEGTLLYDLGCSTGTTLRNLCDVLEENKTCCIGVDSSLPMLKKASLKLAAFEDSHDIELRHEQLQSLSFAPSSFVISHYTLQFLPDSERLPILKNIYQSLVPGGAFIFSEKVRSDSPEDQEYLDSLYDEFKFESGYTREEIQRKKKALQNILSPLTLEENLSLLKLAGFQKPQVLIQGLQFVTILGLAPPKTTSTPSLEK